MDPREITLASSPALMCNNMYAMKDMIVYCHDTQASIVRPSDTKLASFSVHQVDDVNVLVVASSSGLQIWQIDTQQQLLEWSLPAAPQARSGSFCRGIAMAQAEDDSSVLCLGDSEGSIHMFRLDTAHQAEFVCTMRQHCTAIAALASGPAQSSRVNCNVLASCDDSGTIQLCAVKSANDLEQRHSWEGRGIPCTAVTIQDNTLIAALYDGTIYLYDMVNGNLKLELQAHSRMVCAMDVHPNKRLLATAAEDATFAIWTIPNDEEEMVLVTSGCWTNALLTGIAFAGEGCDNLAIAAYDCDKMKLFDIRQFD